MNAAQVVGPEHTPPAFLKRLEHIEGLSQFFVRCRHKPSQISGPLQAYYAEPKQAYYVAPLQANRAVRIQSYHALCVINHKNTVAYVKKGDGREESRKDKTDKGQKADSTTIHAK